MNWWCTLLYDVLTYRIGVGSCGWAAERRISVWRFIGRPRRRRVRFGCPVGLTDLKWMHIHTHIHKHTHTHTITHTHIVYFEMLYKLQCVHNIITMSIIVYRYIVILYIILCLFKTTDVRLLLCKPNFSTYFCKIYVAHMSFYNARIPQDIPRYEDIYFFIFYVGRGWVRLWP